MQVIESDILFVFILYFKSVTKSAETVLVIFIITLFSFSYFLESFLFLSL